jgi:hypothetical protein
MVMEFSKNDTGFGSYFRFEQSVKQETRYLYGLRVRAFLDCVRATISSRKRKLAKDRVLWRAQLGHASQLVTLDAAKVWESRSSGPMEIEVPAPYGCDRMKPQARFAREGRVNPKGIPCLYLAQDPDTAMAEVRPWPGSFVSLARFRLGSDAVVVDCSPDDRDGERPQGDEESDDPAERERAVWNDVAEAFSEPVTPSDSDADYVPTQILAELFRNEGCQGLAYQSRLGKGRNVAIFRLDAAEFVTCDLYSTEAISYTFHKLDDAVDSLVNPLSLGSNSTT